MRGMHTDRGSPNLTLRLRLEDRLKIRLVQTWEVRHRGHLIQYTEAVSYTHLTLPTNREV